MNQIFVFLFIFMFVSDVLSSSPSDQRVTVPAYDELGLSGTGLKHFNLCKSHVLSEGQLKIFRDSFWLWVGLRERYVRYAYLESFGSAFGEYSSYFIGEEASGRFLLVAFDSDDLIYRRLWRGNFDPLDDMFEFSAKRQSSLVNSVGAPSSHSKCYVVGVGGKKEERFVSFNDGPIFVVDENMSYKNNEFSSLEILMMKVYENFLFYKDSQGFFKKIKNQRK